MASTWICKVCGRPNLGDLCPGCAEPRPMMARYSYPVVPQHLYSIYDGVSEPRFEPLLLLIMGPWIFFIFAMMPLFLKATVLTAIGLPIVWNFLLMPLRFAYYRLRNR